MTTALPATNAAPKIRRVGHRGSAGATTVRPPPGHGPVDRWSSRPRLAVVPSESASVGSEGVGSGGVGSEEVGSEEVTASPPLDRPPTGHALPRSRLGIPIPAGCGLFAELLTTT